MSDYVVTYSPALTLVPTYECFNRCSYCNFRVDPHQDTWMLPAIAAQRLAAARSHGVIEILVLSGEVHPQSPRRRAWLQRIYDICAIALQQGYLPHTNVGPLSMSEMAYLKSVNVSMGLMLEQVTPRLLQTVHRHAPSKQPQQRLQQLHQAGKLGIPFTTGVLLGIGESEEDRLDTLRAIAACHDRWGHIQEVILQPYQPGRRQEQAAPALAPETLIHWVKMARQHLPAEVTVQIPPNLLPSMAWVLRAIEQGARDLGGLSPLDEVNPDYPHPSATQLQQHLKAAGWRLRPRLPVYPQYDAWLVPALRQSVARWRATL